MDPRIHGSMDMKHRKYASINEHQAFGHALLRTFGTPKGALGRGIPGGPMGPIEVPSSAAAASGGDAKFVISVPLWERPQLGKTGTFSVGKVKGI